LPFQENTVEATKETSGNKRKRRKDPIADPSSLESRTTCLRERLQEGRIVPAPAIVKSKVPLLIFIMNALLLSVTFAF
jgi:hypothetical protein